MAYHPSTLIQLKAKGNKWYVQVTKPAQLQKPGSVQERRSTGTIDKKIAEQRQHAKTQEIYLKFDQQLGVDRNSPRPQLTYITSQPDPFVALRPVPAFDPDDPKKKISLLRPAYIEQRNWNREKTKNGADKHIQEFTALVGDLPVDKLKKKHPYDYAQYLDDTGKANSTIKTRVSSVKNFMAWCEQRGHIDANVFQNLTLFNYGQASKHYRPLSTPELKKLFEQEMRDIDRLCLSLLATTGMRLDEVALLEWSQIKIEHNTRFIDLTEAIVKTAGSERKVPLHNRMRLPDTGTGRIFDYAIGQDGKAQGDASKKLMPILRKAVGENPRKVVHSLRGNFKDMMRNAGTSKELNDFITGHGAGDVADDYGAGHALKLRSLAVNSLDISFLGRDALHT